MLKPKKGFENSQVSFRVGSATHTIKVSDITPELMDKVKHHVDLSYFVEEVEKPETIYNPEEHDIETVLQKVLNEKPKKTRKKKR
jgi:hypothetical protein